MTESYSIPSRFPAFTFLGLAGGLILSLVVFGLWLHNGAAFQRFYLPQTLSAAAWSKIPNAKPRSYRIFVIPCSTGSCFATERDLLQDFDRAGSRYRSISLKKTSMLPSVFAAKSTSLVYGGSVAASFRWPLILGCLLMAAGLIAGACFDLRKRRQWREGIQIDGRRLVAVRKFNRRSKRTDLCFRIEPHANSTTSL